MKILLVNDYGTATGGAELQMLRLREGLRERGHDARLFSSTASLVPAPVRSEFTCFGTTSAWQPLSSTLNFSAARRLERALDSFRPDVVHVRMFLWQLSPLILGPLTNYPAIYQTATYKCICPKGTKLLNDGTPCERSAGWACLSSGCLTPQTWLPQMLQRRLFRERRGVFQRIIALSQRMKTILEADGIRPVEVIHNGVPALAARPPLGGRPVLGYAGRLSAEKGLPMLLCAFAKVRRDVPQAELWLAGEGPERARLEALAASRGLVDCVRFFGHLTREEMELQFQSVWVQAIPSLWDEPFGNVATEAMMRGTAVISSNTGGLAEILADPAAAILLSPRDEAAWAQAVTQMLANRERAEAMGQAGRARALAHFSEAVCLDKFEALYRELGA